MSDIPIRTPTQAQIEAAQIPRYLSWLERTRGRSFSDYEALWRWSVTDPEGFWGSLWDYFGIISGDSPGRVLESASMPGACWFPGTRLNYVDQVFRHVTDTRPAIVFGSESGLRLEIGWHELRRQVASVAAELRRMGVQSGDRVAAYLPNVPQTVVAFLACASLGALWSVCSTDMGPSSVLDRFRQIEPKVLFACDGSTYAGRRHDRTGVVAELLAQLPTVRHVVWLSYLNPDTRLDARVDVRSWDEISGRNVPLEPVALPFDHPLWIVYSSGTTGLPKAIVHGHGGILLESLKLAHLHNDLSSADRFFWYSTTGWIMWNLQVAGLLTGATICLFDGSPGGSASEPDLTTLWRFVAESGVTFFGAGAAFHASCLKAGIAPAQIADFSQLRTIGSTGSPLSPDVERWLYASLGRHIWISAISGGTDVASAFVGGNITLPSHLGEMQCRCLGARVEAWSEEGKPLVDEVGELVVTAPMPSMPLYFLNDPGNRRYSESYFDVFPGVWRHGDWIRITSRRGACGAVIYGRSDATINRHGIRMGTSELYRALESLPEVVDSLVVDLEYLGRESFMPLFVVLRPGVALDEELKTRIVTVVRTRLSARHVPSEIFQIAEVPRTLTGKKLELPIKRLLLGQSPEKLFNRDSLGNPASLDWFMAFAQRLNSSGDA
jgi:acetoacetyl-CoA synthetase